MQRTVCNMSKVMKGKAKKTTSKKDTGNKVFDVMRPGKTTASATSRPVIVGHKPQVKDPMMAERNDEERALLDSTQKVTIQPGAPTEPTGPQTKPDEEGDMPQTHTAPDLPDTTADAMPAVTEQDGGPEAPTIASVAVTGSVEKPAATLGHAEKEPETEQTAADFLANTSFDKASSEPETAAGPQTELPPEPSKPPETPASPVSSNPGTVGVVYEEPAAPAQPVKPPGNVDPLPVLPDEPTPQPIIVAHHTPKAGAGKVFLSLFLVLIFALLVFDILLDAGFIVLENIPHTDFF
jgi:hypothetical protein